MYKNIKSEYPKRDFEATLVELFLPISYHPYVDYFSPFPAFTVIGISPIITE